MEWAEIQKDLVHYRSLDPWHDAIENYLKGKEKVTAPDCYAFAIARGSSDMARYGRAEANRITETLRRLNCQEVVTGGQRTWKVPMSIQGQKPRPEADLFAEKIRSLKSQ